MDYRAPLAKARGLGSAKSGTHHWWMQRVTAVMLIPLSFWLVLFLNLTFTASYAQTVAWLASPINSIAMITWILMVCYHAALGLQVVIEDYVAASGVKIVTIWLVNLTMLLLAVTALLGIFRITLLG
ncbi:MAG: succinate dehydrogenase, hydrophobic membrane anchor protein [Methylococcaceae bacterium]|nr:succinate dehydrogenase, hydrophobic membrane anchor protein [Methylococcaceae bacterium]MDZ4098792.1 succinate dehydrogenase, hydrophobic membrane anchor protein [Methylophilaceae bacterium]MDZ4157617.1 succinate dehydrogenase, hydrophobic membrane anchor protein [Methylococcales bacterium]MDP2393131.1 succinate dehydrogenase, hydrophobic membrane anchor protein [Methylococcaceae bacterium]MDP3019275.1 succinate dehydrogenase, hydrophobic membrane anchor protein [Methylococcaceae bacterium]